MSIALLLTQAPHSRLSSFQTRLRWWIRSSQSHPEAVAHPDQAVAHPGLDRRQRGVEQLGDLAVGVAVVVGQRDGLALKLGQIFQAPTPLPALDAPVPAHRMLALRRLAAPRSDP